jgi:hypothetical protein
MVSCRENVGAGGNEINRIGEALLEATRNGKDLDCVVKLVGRKWAVKS